MIEAFVLIRVQPFRSDEASIVMASLKREIQKVEGVKETKGVFGRYDFVAIVEAKTSQDLGVLVTNIIKSVRRVAETVETETLVVGF